MDSDGEEYGEFEDLQTGEVFGPRGGGRNGGDSDSDEGDDSEAESDDNDLIDAQLREVNAAKKAKSALAKIQSAENGEVGFMFIVLWTSSNCSLYDHSDILLSLGLGKENRRPRQWRRGRRAEGAGSSRRGRAAPPGRAAGPKPDGVRRGGGAGAATSRRFAPRTLCSPGAEGGAGRVLCGLQT